MIRRERCGGPGHREIFEGKQEARDYARGEFAARHGGRGHTYRCNWGEHYHVTKGLMGQRGSGSRKRGAR